jgi:hypothetical protein
MQHTTLLATVRTPHTTAAAAAACLLLLLLPGLCVLWR